MKGRQVLVPAREEQRGGEALAGRPAAEGEPDLCARRLPGAGERRPPPGGGRHEERAGPLQEHHQQVRESARRLVRAEDEEEEEEDDYDEAGGRGGRGSGNEKERVRGKPNNSSTLVEVARGAGRRRSAVSAVRHRGANTNNKRVHAVL